MSERFPGSQAGDLDFMEAFVRDIFGDRDQILDYMEGMWKIARIRAWEAASADLPKIIEAEIKERAMRDAEEDIITIQAVVIER